MAKRQVQIPAPFDTWYTIIEATEAMGYKHTQYTRKLVKDEKLGDYVEFDGEGNFTGTVVKLDMGGYSQWRIDPQACIDYKAQAAAGGRAFGQHAVRRMLFRFSTAHYTTEEVTALLLEAMGPAEVDGEFRYEFAPAWSGKRKATAQAKGKGKGKVNEPATVIQARILSSLTGGDDEVAEDAEDGEGIFVPQDASGDLDDVLS